MEDRHYLSEPRPVFDATIPTWDVDIMREGVDVPILTIQIDKTFLPPRKSKKKIVWKLPDSLDTVPKFGVYEKKRILEIFKEKKKELKKSKRRASQSSSPPASGSGPVSHASIANATKAPNIDEKPRLDDNNEKIQNTTNVGNHRSNGITNGQAAATMIKKQLSASVASSSPSPPPGLEALSLDTETSLGSERHHNVPQDGNRPLPPPPGLLLSHRTASLPETFSGLLPTDEARPQTAIPQQSKSIQHPSYHSRHSMETSTGADNPDPLHSFRPHLHLRPLPPSRRCFMIPPAMAATSPVALGTVVAETYYMLLQRGLVAELASHYAQDAQKSLTVGGAYAACASVADRCLQLQSLAGNIKPHIKGIQQQPTLAGGVMLMITGVSVRPPQSFLLPFCHTLVLCPVMTTTNPATNSDQNVQHQRIDGYQIQNDNLVFLTGDDNGGGVASQNGGISNGTTTGAT